MHESRRYKTDYAYSPIFNFPLPYTFILALETDWQKNFKIIFIVSPKVISQDYCYIVIFLSWCHHTFCIEMFAAYRAHCWKVIHCCHKSKPLFRIFFIAEFLLLIFYLFVYLLVLHRAWFFLLSKHFFMQQSISIALNCFYVIHWFYAGENTLTTQLVCRFYQHTHQLE